MCKYELPTSRLSNRLRDKLTRPKLYKLKFHWDQFPRNFPVANVTGKSPTSYVKSGVSGVSPACYEEVGDVANKSARKLRENWSQWNLSGWSTALVSTIWVRHSEGPALLCNLLSLGSKLTAQINGTYLTLSLTLTITLTLLTLTVTVRVTLRNGGPLPFQQ